MQTLAWKLKQFNTRAKYLEESRFLQWINSRDNKQPNITELIAGNWLVYEGLHREDLDSFILNLRLLIQDSDGYSIRCLANFYQEFPPDYQEAKDAFIYVRGLLNSYLSSPSKIRLRKGRDTSKRVVLETILYGGFAHTNPRHHKNFLALTTSGVFSMFVFTEFVNIIFVISDYIRRLAILNDEVLRWDASPNNSFKGMPLRGIP